MTPVTWPPRSATATVHCLPVRLPADTVRGGNRDEKMHASTVAGGDRGMLRVLQYTYVVLEYRPVQCTRIAIRLLARATRTLRRLGRSDDSAASAENLTWLQCFAKKINKQYCFAWSVE